MATSDPSSQIWSDLIDQYVNRVPTRMSFSTVPRDQAQVKATVKVIAADDNPTFEESVHMVMSEAANLLLRKHNDYGPGNISGAPGGALNGIRVRLYDKIARINHLLDTGAEPQNESLEDSFRDALNYCAIALLVMNGQWPE